MDHTTSDIQRNNDELLIGVETRQLLEDNEDMSSQEKNAVLRYKTFHTERNLYFLTHKNQKQYLKSSLEWIFQMS